MSLIIGIHLGDLVMLAADKRAVTYICDETIVLTDESEKIIDVGIGHLTGSGYVDLLRSVEHAMRDANIDHTNQIVQIINDKREALRQETTDVETTESYITATGWLFTYGTVVDGQPKMRVAIVHPSLGEDVGLVEEGTAKLIGPIDCDPCDVARVSDWLNANLKLTREIPDYVQCLKYHVPYLMACFSDIADNCKSVSKAFHVAIMCADGARAISDAIGSAPAKEG